MQVKEVAVCRIFNTGNYENTRIEVRLALDPSDEANKSILTGEKIILDYWANKKEGKTLDQILIILLIFLLAGVLFSQKRKPLVTATSSPSNQHRPSLKGLW